MRADPDAGRQPRPDAGPLLTHVELTWLEGRIEHWIRFGHDTSETILDRRRRVLSFAPRSVFAFVRWASNDFGTIISCIDIVRAIGRGEPYQTLPSSVLAATSCCALRDGQRSSAYFRPSTPWKRLASIRLTPHPTTGATFTTDSSPANRRGPTAASSHRAWLLRRRLAP